RSRNGLGGDALPRRARAGLSDRGRSGPDRPGGVHLRPARCERTGAGRGGRLRSLRGRGPRRDARHRPPPRRRRRNGGGVAAGGGTGGKWRGRDQGVGGGLGVASTEVDAARVAALAVVNAAGDIIAADGSVVAGSTAPAGTPAFAHPEPFEESRDHTTLAVVV